MDAAPEACGEPPRPPSRRVLAAATALAFVLALALLAGGASLRDLWRADEHRYVEVARQMVRHDAWLVPRIDGRIYTDKPPAFFWAVAFGHRTLGLELASAGMAPSVLGAAACVAVVFALAGRLYGLPEAVAAGCVLISSELFVNLALRANLDALLTFTTTAAVAAYAAAEETAVSRHALRLLAAAAALALALGVLVKGFVAWMVPAAAVAGHRLLTRGAPRRVGAGALLGVLGLAALFAGAWLVAAMRSAGLDYGRELALGHGVGHALGYVSKQGPPWYYLDTFPAGFVPWIALLPAALVPALRRPRRSPDLLLLAWLFLPLLLFSAFPAKRHLYLAPLHPAAALLVARALGPRLRGLPPQAGAEARLWDAGSYLLGVAAVLSALLLLLAALLPPSWSGWGGAWTALLAEAPLPRLLAAALGAGLLAAGVTLTAAGRMPRLQGRAACAIGLLVAGSLAGVFHPLEARGNDFRAFYRAVAARVGDGALAGYGGLDHAPNWLLGRDSVPVLGTRAEAEAFLARDPRRSWLLAEPEKLERLGLPAGARIVLRAPLPLDDDELLLLAQRGRAALPSPQEPPAGRGAPASGASPPTPPEDPAAR